MWDRGAPRVSRGGTSVGGHGGARSPPRTEGEIEERPGFPGAGRALGGMGGARSPPFNQSKCFRVGQIFAMGSIGSLATQTGRLFSDGRQCAHVTVAT